MRGTGTGIASAASRGPITTRLTLRATTGAKILVWREDELFHVAPVGATQTPEICLAIDLFEVIADQAELDLERRAQAAEAIELAETAQRRLASLRPV